MHKVLLLAVTALCAACTSTSLSANKEKECAAIESTIERFLQAHAARDYETWGHAWVQKPYVTFSALAPQYNYYDCGWTNLYNAQKRYFMAEEKLDQERGRTQTIEPSDYQFRIYDDCACVHFRITWTTHYKDQTKPETYVSDEFYTFEKVDDEWKVASINAIDVTAYLEQAQVNVPPLPTTVSDAEPAASESKM